MARCYNSKLVFNNISSVAESKPMSIGDGEILKIQVDGTATSFSIEVLGSALEGLSYNSLRMKNDTTEIESNTITANGIYTIDVSGLYAVKFKIASISGGNITVLGKSMSNEEYGNGGTGGSSVKMVTLTQTEYDELVSTGSVDEETYYYIKEG